MINNDISKYKDIINLPHHVSKKHPQMSIESRAAQFAPFAALTGYSDAIKETSRLTSEKIELDEEIKQDLDNKLKILQDKVHLKPKVTITYFVPDKRKQGGAYLTITGNVKKIDVYNQLIFFTDNTEISIKNIYKILHK